MSVGRRAAQILLMAATVVVGLVALALIASQTPWFKDWLRGVAERQAGKYLNGELEIGGLSGSLFFGARLDDVRIVQDGETVVSMDDVALDYNPLDLIAGRLSFEQIRVNSPLVRLGRTETGWQITGLFAAAAAPPGERRAARPVEIDRIELADGRVLVGPEPDTIGGFRVPNRILDLDAALSITREPERTVVKIDHLSFTGEEPDLVMKEVTGRVLVLENDLVFEDVRVQMADSTFTLDGTIENFRAAGDTESAP